jgi:hypothetical protein
MAKGFVVLGLLLAARFACAQTTGDLDGAVTDSSNAPLPGVSLEARSPSLQGVRTTTSDHRGLFRFPILPPGTYTVSTSLSGFKPAVRTNLRVGLGETTFAPMTMVLEIKAEIEVAGEPPLVDLSSTRLGTSLTAAEMSRLPLGRNYTSVASILAGTGQDVGGITVYGATGLENQYVIDGVNTTGIRYGNQGKSLNAEFVQEVEVRTGGYEAEFGQVFGGSINVITKSGGNEFHGGVFGYYDGEQLASANKNVSEQKAALQSQPGAPSRYDAGFDLGGYLVRDRLWFFGAYDRVATDQDYNRFESLTFTPEGIQGTSKSGTDRTRMDLFSGKLTYRAGSSHTFAVSVFGDPGSFDGRSADAADAAGPDAAVLVQRSTGGTDLSVRWDGLFGSHFIGQAQYGHHEERNGESSVFFNDQPAFIQKRQGTIQILPGSGPPVLRDDTYRRDVYRLSGSALLESHEVKAGIFYERLNSSVSIRRSGGETIFQYLDDTGAFNIAEHDYYARVPLNCIAKTDGSLGNFGFIDPTTCAGYQETDHRNQNPRIGNLALFAQDSWKIAGNLTLNAGVRYEEQRIFDAAGNPVVKLTGQWSPRVGAVWDPLKNGRSKVFASYGRYYQVIPQDIQIRALGSEVNVAAYNYTADKPDPIAAFPYPAFAQSGDYVPPGIKGTYQDEVIAGVEYEFMKNWSIGVKGIYRSLGRVLEDRCDVYDPRAQIGDLVPASSLASCVVVNVGEGALGQFADPTNPDCFADYPANNEPIPCESVRARRYFRGLQMDLSHRFADNFFLKASYLYSKLVGSYDGFVNELTGQQSPAENLAFDYIDVLPNNFGRLSLDRTHQLKVSGSYSFPFGLLVGLNSFASSGAPLSILGWAHANGYDNARFLVPRGSAGELPWTYNVDLHLEYRFALGPVSVIPVFDVFNLTNVQQTVGRDQVYNRQKNGNQNPPFTNPTNPTYGLDNAFQAPRLVRLGMRVSF